MPTNPDSDLMRIFDFTAEDLEANRAGKLSERQAKYLKSEGDADRYAVGCAVRVGFLVVTLIGVAVLLQPQKLNLDVSSLLQIIGIVVVLAVLYRRFQTNQGAIQSDLERMRAGYVAGIATWQHVVKQKAHIYKITVDGKAFRVERTTYNSFEKFMCLRSKYMVFRIYFAPEISKILSVEIVSH